MAIDTAEKRRASIGFGMPGSAGTLIPTGASSAFRRGSALGLFVIEGGVSPDLSTMSGCIVSYRSRTAAIGSRSRTVGVEDRFRAVTVEQNR